MADCVSGHDTGTSEKIRAMFYDISPLGRQAVSQGCRPRALKGNENQPVICFQLYDYTENTPTRNPHSRKGRPTSADRFHGWFARNESGPTKCGSEVQLATGTQYEMGRKADEWARVWETSEGFKRLPAGKPAFESLELTIALAKRMGFTILCDDRYKTDLNLKGEVFTRKMARRDAQEWWGLRLRFGSIAHSCTPYSAARTSAKSP
jgi:hypothetical protein